MKTKKDIQKEIQRLYDEGGDAAYIDNQCTRETLEWVIGESEELPA